MRCPYRFGDVQETCYKEECHAYGKTLRLADVDTLVDKAFNSEQEEES